MAVSYRYARPDEYPALSSFLHEHWANNHVYCRERKLFDWTFARRDLWRHDGFSFAMAEDQDQLVGILGGIPFEFNTFGKTSTGVWIANYVIRADYRRGATALQLLSMFRKPEFQPVIAFGINPATGTIYKVLRGEVLPHIPRYFAVLNGCVPSMAGLIRKAQPDWEHGRSEALAAAFELPSPSPVSSSVMAGLPNDWDSVGWPQFADRSVGAVRDSRFIQWRYLDHPNFDYQVLSVSEGASQSILVWRLETVRERTEGGLRDLARIARLVELIPAKADHAQALLVEFLRRAHHGNAVAADYYGFHGEVRRALAAAGLRDAESHADGGSIPSRFQPLDGKGGRILSAMFGAPGIPPCRLDDENPWYWTKSDSDQDRPN